MGKHAPQAVTRPTAMRTKWAGGPTRAKHGPLGGMFSREYLVQLGCRDAPELWPAFRSGPKDNGGDGVPLLRPGGEHGGHGEHVHLRARLGVADPHMASRVP